MPSKRFCSIIGADILIEGEIAMRSIQTEGKTVTIRLSGEPVPGRGEVLRLVRQALAENGFAPWEETKAECFSAGEETLVIARPGEAKRRLFFFPELESLLAGAACVPADDGAVYAAEDGYILALPSGAVCPALYEFGRELRLSPLWEHHAREMGLCVLPERAPAVLRESF